MHKHTTTAQINTNSNKPTHANTLQKPTHKHTPALYEVERGRETIHQDVLHCGSQHIRAVLLAALNPAPEPTTDDRFHHLVRTIKS